MERWRERESCNDFNGKWIEQRENKEKSVPIILSEKRD